MFYMIGTVVRHMEGSGKSTVAALFEAEGLGDPTSKQALFGVGSMLIIACEAAWMYYPYRYSGDTNSMISIVLYGRSHELADRALSIERSLLHECKGKAVLAHSGRTCDCTKNNKGCGF